jgi:flagellar biosynthetic protein FliP
MAVLVLAIIAMVAAPARAQLLSAGNLAATGAGGDDAEGGLTGPASLDNPLSIIGAASGALKGLNAGGAGETGAGSKTAGDKGGGGGGGGLSTGINILVVLTVITLAPSIMLMTTCFVRITIVLGLLKQAIGTQTLPPPQVILGLSLFMTLLVMSPTLDRIHKEAITPYNAGAIRDYDVLWAKTRQPMRDFMFDQIERTGNWSSVYMVLNYRGVDTSRPELLKYSDVDMISLVPAFMLSELKTAFLIGFKVYLPFLVIDMVISAILISMGMMMLPPVLISLPFKLLLFVLVDGWQLVVGSLLQSFATRGPPGSAGTGAVSWAPLRDWMGATLPAIGIG